MFVLAERITHSAETWQNFMPSPFFKRLFVTNDVVTRYFFVVFSWLSRGPHFGQILRVLALEKFSDFSTPNMTGQRIHRTTEAIPRRPCKAQNPFASRESRHLRISMRKGTREVCARYDTVLLPFISIVRWPGRPVIPVPTLGISIRK